MIVTPSNHGATALVSSFQQEQPWELAMAGVDKLDMSSSDEDEDIYQRDDSVAEDLASDKLEPDSSDEESCQDDDDSVAEDLASVIKEDQSTVCTSRTSESSVETLTSVDENEVDVDALLQSLDVGEVDVDELVSKTCRKFKGHRSSILIPQEQTAGESTEEAANTPPKLERASTAPSKIDSSTRRPRSSIKLASLQAPIPLKEKKSSWKQLPMPDMAKIYHRSSSLPLELEGPASGGNNRRRTVSFSEIHIRNYAQTIGDNPSVSYGPPITLDWDFEECQPITVDDYEQARGQRRKLQNMSLNYYQRISLLQNAFGHSEEELKQAKKQANQDKWKRAVTKYFLPVQLLEDAAESGVRKTKRMLQRKRHSTAA